MKNIELPGSLKRDYVTLGVGVPEVGDLYLDSCGVVKCVNRFQEFEARLIVSKRFPWPHYLAPGWLAKDFDGSWFWYPEKPHFSSGFTWVANSSVRMSELQKIFPALKEIVFPGYRIEDSLVEVGCHERY